MNFNENNLWREKTEFLYLRLSKLARAKVSLKLEFDTEDQVLLLLVIILSSTVAHIKEEYWCKTRIEGVHDWGKTKTSILTVE